MESSSFDKDSFGCVLLCVEEPDLYGNFYGFVTVETRSVECVVPADPADPRDRIKSMSDR